MNRFIKYLNENQLDIEEMSSDEIIYAFHESGSSNHNDLKEAAEQLPWIRRLQVLIARLEDVLQPSVKGEHISDS